MKQFSVSCVIYGAIAAGPIVMVAIFATKTDILRTGPGGAIMFGILIGALLTAISAVVSYVVELSTEHHSITTFVINSSVIAIIYSGSLYAVQNSFYFDGIVGYTGGYTIHIALWLLATSLSFICMIYKSNRHQ